MSEFQEYYYSHPYARELDTIVISCHACKEGYEIALKDTIFYPEGGGQPCDKGVIQDITVLDVQRKEDQIIHILKQSLPIGEKVHCIIDWEYRYDLMQNHTGEHIFSGLVKKLYGYSNVGFHMGEYICADFRGDLTEEMIQDVEQQVNQAIWANLPVREIFCAPSETGKYEYRSKIEIAGITRIVSIEDYDMCACCGMHVSHTGEIGICKVINFEKSGNKTRVFLLSGRRAFAYLNHIQQESSMISKLLSTKSLEISTAVSHLHQRYLDVQKSYRTVSMEMMMKDADKTSLHDAIIYTSVLADSEGMRAFCNRCIERGVSTVMVIAKTEVGYAYVIMSKCIDLQSIRAEFNKRIHAKGGGNSEMMQGSCTATPTEISHAFGTLTGVTMHIVS
jgi:tRNA synthetases class II (A)